MNAFEYLGRLWSATNFKGAELTAYAHKYIEDDVRKGIMLLGVVSLLLLSAAALLYALLGFGMAYVYTFTLLAVLALHVTISTRVIRATQMLYLLGMTLLIIAGTAFVLLAHKTGTFSAALLSCAVLLFMVVPLVPWGLREAFIVVMLIYSVFTLSTLSIDGRFDGETIWLLQFLMLGSGITTLTVVARNVGIRKNDIMTRFELENAHREMKQLSYKDPLTSSWNRRFLDQKFNSIINKYRETNRPFHLAFIDVDEFKQLNDTYGHDCGDMALQLLTRVIMEHIKADDYLIRLGGDEFVLLFNDEEPEVRIQSMIDGLKSSPELQNEGADIPIRISTGLISVDPQQKVTLEQLYKEADKALYSAKSLKETGGKMSHVVHHAYPVRQAG